MPGKGYLAQQAEKHGRDYITPEDVQAGVDARVPQIALWGELIAILARHRDLGAEDHSLCCFTALRYEADPVKVERGTFKGPS